MTPLNLSHLDGIRWYAALAIYLALIGFGVGFLSGLVGAIPAAMATSPLMCAVFL